MANLPLRYFFGPFPFAPPVRYAQVTPVTEHVSIHSVDYVKTWHVRLASLQPSGCDFLHPLSWGRQKRKDPFLYKLQPWFSWII